MEMTKRACPFESEVSRQLKVHVGQKEVNSGVLKEKQMQSVYGEYRLCSCLCYRFYSLFG